MISCTLIVLLSRVSSLSHSLNSRSHSHLSIYVCEVGMQMKGLKVFLLHYIIGVSHSIRAHALTNTIVKVTTYL